MAPAMRLLQPEELFVSNREVDPKLQEEARDPSLCPLSCCGRSLSEATGNLTPSWLRWKALLSPSVKSAGSSQ